jgi:P-type Cu2+ transporter
VIGGTVNGSGSLRVAVTRIGDSTALAGIMRLVAQAQSSRSRAQALADRAARLLTIAAVVAALATLGARHRLIVRDRRGLEEARNVTAVLFDKAGTLTRGESRVAEITTKPRLAHDAAPALAAALAGDSER